MRAGPAPALGLTAALLRQRGHLFPWVPVWLGAGIGLYFALSFEPVPGHYLIALAAALAGAAAIRPLGAGFGPLAIALVLVACGFGLAGFRSHLVAAPVLEFCYYGPVQGRIVAIDRSSRDVPRITLDRVVLADMAPGRIPARVRVSIYGDQPALPDIPGTVVILTAFLSPPAGPAEPGDFDFRRHAWFDRLGAVGYTETPVLTLLPPVPAVATAIARLRLHLSEAVRSVVGGEPGGFAAAVMTGDRSGISEATNDAMRAANLYHLVSISGTHMVLLVGFVFAVIRGGIALVPPVALRISGKKVAAAVALPIAAIYLALAGRDMATERAFIMVAVMLVAVLADRQAITLRAVAIAALVVLGLRPESLTNPGFQMSFAASLALVAAFGALRTMPRGGLLRSVVAPALMLLMSSFVAGSATAPFAAAHFNRVAHFGLVANLLAVPAMGFLVMPGAVVLAVLGPLGLPGPGALMLDLGSRWILFVSDRVAALDGAQSGVPTPPSIVLPLIAAGGLWLILWQGAARFAGIAVMVVALALWWRVERPAVLVAETGGIVGIMGPAGRVLTRDRGDSFAAESWLENDGDIADMAAAAARPGVVADGRVVRAEAGNLVILHVRGVTALAGIAGCDGADVLVANVPAGDRPCLTFDADMLARTGAVAIIPGPGAPLVTSVAGQTGPRLWTIAGQ